MLSPEVFDNSQASASETHIQNHHACLVSVGFTHSVQYCQNYEIKVNNLFINVCMKPGG